MAGIEIDILYINITTGLKNNLCQFVRIRVIRGEIYCFLVNHAFKFEAGFTEVDDHAQSVSCCF